MQKIYLIYEDCITKENHYRYDSAAFRKQRSFPCSTAMMAEFDTKGHEKNRNHALGHQLYNTTDMLWRPESVLCMSALCLCILIRE